MSDTSSCADAQPQLGLAEHTFNTPTTYLGLYLGMTRFVDQAANKYHRMNKKLDLDDLKQSGYIALWDAYQSYVPERGVPIEHYARRAVVNRMINECKRDRSQRESRYHECDLISEDEAEGNGEYVFDSLSHSDTGENDPVFQAYAGKQLSEILFGSSVPLTISQRQVLDLLFLQGLKVQEAADLLGVSHQSVSKQQHKAITVCRSHLGVTMH